MAGTGNTGAGGRIIGALPLKVTMMPKMRKKTDRPSPAGFVCGRPLTGREIREHIELEVTDYSAAGRSWRGGERHGG
jgi:hypothetical protein